MLTVVETLLFQKQWPLYWTEDERGTFAAYIAEHPTAGDVVPESGGIRKVRWGRADSGKSGGVRVICFTRSAEGEVIPTRRGRTPRDRPSINRKPFCPAGRRTTAHAALVRP